MVQPTTTNALQVSPAPNRTLDINDLSYLEFVFYHSKATGSFIRKKLYFMQSPTVVETRKANYAKYTPISRNGAIPYYLGSESRFFKLDTIFSYTGLEQNTIILNQIIKKNEENNKFRGNTTTITLDSSPATVYSKLPNINANYENRIKAQSLIYAYLNLIRTSVVNNAENPTEGPPIIRLNYGSLYSDIPCICTDYSIEEVELIDSKAKDSLVDPVTKLYPIIKVSMSLEEVRLGNYLKTEFNPTDETSRDNIVGWEQIIDDNKSGSFDPITPILR